jgi:hypothetical protein
MENRTDNLLYMIAKSISHYKGNDNGLFTGFGGLALYELSYGNYYNNDEFILTGLTFIEKIFNTIDNRTKDSLCSGLSGLGWLLNYIKLQEWDICSNIDSVMFEIDCCLITRLDKYLSINYWGFLHGYIGIGHYLLQRIHVNDKAEKAIDSILLKLEDPAIISLDNTVKWKSIIDLKDNLIGIIYHYLMV